MLHVVEVTVYVSHTLSPTGGNALPREIHSTFPPCVVIRQFLGVQNNVSSAFGFVGRRPLYLMLTICI